MLQLVNVLHDLLYLFVQFRVHLGSIINEEKDVLNILIVIILADESLLRIILFGLRLVGFILRIISTHLILLGEISIIGVNPLGLGDHVLTYLVHHLHSTIY